MRFLPYLLVAYVLTLPAEFIAGVARPSADFMAWLKIATLSAFAWHAAGLYARQRPDPRSTVLLAVVTGITWFTVLVIHAFRVVTMTPLSLSLVLTSLDDSRRTAIQTLGEHGAVLAVAALVVLGLALSAGAWLVVHEVRKRWLVMRPGRLAALACGAGLCYLIAVDARYAALELVLDPTERFSAFPLRKPDYSALKVRPGESVFILQLESVNATVLFEPAPDGQSLAWRIPLPGLRAVLDEGRGVLLPFFWANSTQTHRAQESILCAVSGNIGEALALDPLRLQGRTCLPRHLADAGYRTVFLYSYFDLEFYNLGAFHKSIGFADVVHGTRLMASGDRRHAWGYDDCVFYERAFDHLAQGERSRRDPQFAYFVVGMNHAPYSGPAKYPEAHPFPSPKGATEQYLNSVAEQDHCLRTFWRRFRALQRDDIHLFIVPDHSVPLGNGTGSDADFVTWLAYVPPERRRVEIQPRAVLEPRAGQAQIYPTVLELLGAERASASFAFMLRGAPRPASYDDCHLMHDSFLARLLVVNGAEKAELQLSSGESVSTTAGRERLGYWGFRERYYCR